MYAYLAVLAIVALTWYLTSYLRWYNDVFKPLKGWTKVTRLPIVGTKYIFLGLPREELFPFMMKRLEENRPIFCSWAGSIPEIHLMKAEYLEVVMNNSVHIKKGRQYNQLKPWLGEGLLISNGSKWFQHRKLITPTFHFKILENFMDVFVDKSKTLLKNLDAKADGKPFDAYQDITLCALDIICETAMGVTVDAMSTRNNQYVNAVYGISDIVVWRSLRPFITDFIFKFLSRSKKFDEYLRILHGFTSNVIAERRRVLQNSVSKNHKEENGGFNDIGSKKRMSFLDLLLESSDNGRVLSDTDIREEVDTFMFEGHDTTTAGICWSLLLLGNHPEIQEKAFEEVHHILQENSTPTKIAELNEMKYLERVVKEALRLYPSVPMIIRSLDQEITLDECRIPAGTQAALHIYATHRSPEYFPKPNKFDPDRFLPENSQSRHPYSYIPFSAGPRNCIGQKFAMYEEKTILASLINRYKITTVLPQGEIIATVDLILRPLKGAVLKLDRR